MSKFESFSSSSSALSLCGWFGSAWFGYFMEKQYLPESGILITLIASALTVKHPIPFLNEFSWNTILPASLVFLLLSLPEDLDHPQGPNGDKVEFRNHENDMDYYSIPTSIRKLAIPFLLASIGSVLGCILAFMFCLISQNTSSWPSAVPLPKLSWFLPPEYARIALACLAASYVGGSVNFFATAHAIGATTSPILTSMAATDVLVMAIYFTFLAAALNSKKLQRWFLPKQKDSLHPPNQSSPVQPGLSTQKQQEQGPIQTKTNIADMFPFLSRRLDSWYSKPNQTMGLDKEIHDTRENFWKNRNDLFRMVSSFLGISLASGIVVRWANWMDRRWLGRILPGSTCGTISILIFLVKRIWKTYRPNQLGYLQQISIPLYQISFLLLFSSIGATADVEQIVYSGMSCFVVSFLALLVHVLVAFLGSWLWVRSRPGTFRLEHVLVASNAAIGGPATAAAFCGRIQNKPLQGITYAATFWGVIGYAIGTTIGILTYQLLGRILWAAGQA